MWIIKAFRNLGDKGLVTDLVNAEENSPPVENKVKTRFTWSEDLRPIEGMSHAVVREFPLNSDRITIIVPGYGSSGQKTKYEDIISDMLQSGDTAIISTNNPDPYYKGLDVYAESIRQQVIALIQYSIQNAQRLTGRENIKITLYGSSAGGGAAAIAAGLFPEIVDSVILTGPSRDVTEGLKIILPDIVRPFTGKVFLISSENDRICNAETIEQYRHILGDASEFHTDSIPGDDHAFELPQNHEQLRKFVLDSLLKLRVTES